GVRNEREVLRLEHVEIERGGPNPELDLRRTDLDVAIHERGDLARGERHLDGAAILGAFAPAQLAVDGGEVADVNVDVFLGRVANGQRAHVVRFDHLPADGAQLDCGLDHPLRIDGQGDIAEFVDIDPAGGG